MTTFTETIDVDVDLQTAYNQWTQFETFPMFMGGVERVDQLTDTELHWVTKVGPVTREYDAVITEQWPDEVIAWKSVSGTTHEGRVTFQGIDDDSTLVTAMITMEPDDLIEEVGAISGAIENRIAADLRRFKEFIESRGAETGAWRGSVDDADGAQPGGLGYAAGTQGLGGYSQGTQASPVAGDASGTASGGVGLSGPDGTSPMSTDTSEASAIAGMGNGSTGSRDSGLIDGAERGFDEEDEADDELRSSSDGDGEAGNKDWPRQGRPEGGL